MVVRPFSVATFTHFSPLTRTLYLKRSNYFSFVVFLLNLSEVTLVNEITQVLSARFRNASYVCCAVCSPPRVKASVTQEPQAGSLHPGCSGKPSGEHGGAVARHLLLTGGDASAAAGRSCSERPRPQAGESDAHKQNEGGVRSRGRGRPLRWVAGSRAARARRRQPRARGRRRGRPARCLPWPLAGSPRSPEHAEGLSSASTPHLLSRSA